MNTLSPERGVPLNCISSYDSPRFGFKIAPRVGNRTLLRLAALLTRYDLELRCRSPILPPQISIEFACCGPNVDISTRQNPWRRLSRSRTPRSDWPNGYKRCGTHDFHTWMYTRYILNIDSADPIIFTYVALAEWCSTMAKASIVHSWFYRACGPRFDPRIFFIFYLFFFFKDI